ncbi:MAG: hypothetical protein LBT66_02195, partial [Methanobrevibacter sp.]|nr:hypothetical protein [Candidatus Methanovirga meridionalis]
MKFKIWIGKYEKECKTPDIIAKTPTGETVSVKIPESIKLNDSEIKKIELKGVDATVQDRGYNSESQKNRAGVKKEKDFEVKVTCLVRSDITSDTIFGIFEKIGNSVSADDIKKLDGIKSEKDIKGEHVGTITKISKGAYNGIKTGIKSLYTKTKTILAKKNNGEDIWEEIDPKSSAEHCNQIKNWFEAYKPLKEDKERGKSRDGKDGTSAGEEGGEKKEYSLEDVYKDVKIEIVLSDIQSLYYDFKNMYVDEYMEILSTEEGVSTFEFVLKSQYIDSEANFETGNAGIGKFRDKIT